MPDAASTIAVGAETAPLLNRALADTQMHPQVSSVGEPEGFDDILESALQTPGETDASAPEVAQELVGRIGEQPDAVPLGVILGFNPQQAAMVITPTPDARVIDSNLTLSPLPADISTLKPEVSSVKSGFPSGVDTGMKSVTATMDEPLHASVAATPANPAADGKLLPTILSQQTQNAIEKAPLTDQALFTAPMAQAQSSASREATAPVVAPTVGSMQWGASFSDRVTWIASQNQHFAELKLNPPELGPLQVRLSFSNDQMSAVFVSHSAQVRDAIQSALPQLQLMLADNGIQLGQATVSDQSLTQHQMQREARGQGTSQDVQRDNAGIPTNAAVISVGLVDTFA
ncbi:MAG: flagellar hook-length control protein FliK [Burkholderiales bacterium]